MRFLLIIVIIVGSFSIKSFSQTLFYQDVFYGGVTAGGFSTGQGFGKANITIRTFLNILKIHDCSIEDFFNLPINDEQEVKNKIHKK